MFRTPHPNRLAHALRIAVLLACVIGPSGLRLGSAEPADPAATAGAPRYKLVYEDKREDRVAVTFSIAPPGGEYKTHVSGVVKRRAVPASRN